MNLKRSVMNLKYGVVALTPLLGAEVCPRSQPRHERGRYCAGASTCADRIIRRDERQRETETERQADADGAGSKAIQLDTSVPGAENLKTHATRADETQARKGEKKAKDTRTN